MATGDCTISGAYHFNTTEIAAAEAFVETLPNIMSGAIVFAIPSGGNSFYLGIVQGG